MSKLKFEELNLSKELLKAVSDMGFKETTPIQSAAIPEVLSGQDIIGQASTGTGKTAAFGLPAIEKIDENLKAVQVLVLCPTRELAIQVSTEINKFLKYKKNIKALPVYGGQPIQRQLLGLRRYPKIVVGTPGRTLDHLERGTLKINKIKMFVLDEADKMLDMGFRPDIESILRATKKDKQTLLFSATMSREVLQLTNRYQKNPKIIKIQNNDLNKLSIEHVYLKSEPAYKIDFLMDLINKYCSNLSIVFCNTKRKVDKVAKILNQTGFRAAGIHGDMRQSKRDSIMTGFRKGKVKVLVATDVAARGIDVNDVQAVFNFEIPRETEAYVHRIGRTGRAGKSGKAFSLVSRAEMCQLHNIIRYNRVDIKEFTNEPKDAVAKAEPERFKKKDKVISQDSYADTRLEKKVNKVLQKVKQNIVNNEHSVYLNIAQNLTSQKCSPDDLSAALLKIVVEGESQPKRFEKRRFN